MVAGDCYKTCIVEKSEFCIKKRESKVSCLTVFGQTSPLCKETCKGATKDDKPQKECTVDSPRLLNCWEVIDQQDKFKRKIDALDTAITEYIEQGNVVNPVTE